MINLQGLSGITSLQPPLQPQAPSLNSLNNGHALGSIDLMRHVGQSLGTQPEEQASFESFFQAYLNMVNSAGAMETHAQNLQIGFALKEHDDMLSVILAQEMAFTSLNFTVQVTNRIIEAYREIMRMQI